MTNALYDSGVSVNASLGLTNTEVLLLSLSQQKLQAATASLNPFLSNMMYRPMEESRGMVEHTLRTGNGYVIGAAEVPIPDLNSKTIKNTTPDGITNSSKIANTPIVYTATVPLFEWNGSQAIQINDERDQFTGAKNPQIMRRIMATLEQSGFALARGSTRYIADKMMDGVHYVYTLWDKKLNVLVPYFTGYNLDGISPDLTISPTVYTFTKLINQTKLFIGGTNINYNFNDVTTVAEAGLVGSYEDGTNFLPVTNEQVLGNVGKNSSPTYISQQAVQKSPYTLYSRSIYFADGSKPNTGDGYIMPRYELRGTPPVPTLVSGIGGDQGWNVAFLEPVNISPDEMFGPNTKNAGNRWYAYIKVTGMTANSYIAPQDFFQVEDNNKYRYRSSYTQVTVPLQFIASTLSVFGYKESEPTTHRISAKDWGRGIGLAIRISITTPLRLPTKIVKLDGLLENAEIVSSEGIGNLLINGVTIDPTLVKRVTMYGGYAYIQGISQADSDTQIVINDNSPNAEIRLDTHLCNRKVKTIQAALFNATSPTGAKPLPIIPRAGDFSMAMSWRPDAVNQLPIRYEGLNQLATYEDIINGRGRNSYGKPIENMIGDLPLAISISPSHNSSSTAHILELVCGLSTLVYSNNTNYCAIAFDRRFDTLGELFYTPTPAPVEARIINSKKA